MSGAEISFTVDRSLSPGMEMQLSLDWPLPLDGICPLQLMIFGRVIRSAKEGGTLKIARYEFRTRTLRSQRPAESPRT